MALPLDAPAPLQTDVTHEYLLDQTVDDVFSTMLSAKISRTETSLTPSNSPVTLTAVIGLAGALSGAFTLVVNADTAKQIASMMLGIEAEELDGDVYDAVGEITNILAGSWKSHTPALQARCLLSVPTVVAGTSYDVHRKATSFSIARSYTFDDAPLTINISGEWT